ILESRLDNLVYRAGFATSRAQARQLVNHGHFLVNGRKVNVPSYRVRVGDVVTLRERSSDLLVVEHSVDTSSDRSIPEWLEVDKEDKKITVRDLPNRAQIDTPVQEQLIVELYSK
ncbi:MAG: 30S ribosomal protein S4, partial [Actinomycetota bacterium]|nr:30S ribosomal protein S4 [Actinomycetota bacterium]